MDFLSCGRTTVHAIRRAPCREHNVAAGDFPSLASSETKLRRYCTGLVPLRCFWQSACLLDLILQRIASAGSEALTRYAVEDSVTRFGARCRQRERMRVVVRNARVPGMTTPNTFVGHCRAVSTGPHRHERQRPPGSLPAAALPAMLLRGFVHSRLVAFAPGAGDLDPGLLGQRADEPPLHHSFASVGWA